MNIIKHNICFVGLVSIAKISKHEYAQEPILISGEKWVKNNLLHDASLSIKQDKQKLGYKISFKTKVVAKSVGVEDIKFKSLGNRVAIALGFPGNLFKFYGTPDNPMNLKLDYHKKHLQIQVEGYIPIDSASIILPDFLVL